MALFVLIVLIINSCFTSLLGSEYNDDNSGFLVIIPSTVTNGNGQHVGLYKVNDTLNLTCTFTNKNDTFDVFLDWAVPTKATNSQNRVLHQPGSNFVNLIIENLQETDSGEYKCRASHNGTPTLNMETSIRINVKNKVNTCPDTMFPCHKIGVCIHRRYTCDGYKDCKNGEDESPLQCGPNPCDNKLKCPDNRCIPSAWCCESFRDANCTTKVKHSCCTHLEKLTRDLDIDSGFQYEQQRFNDMGFLQTTVYTVIGCAMAFMFIVTIIIIAICRVHVRRNPLSRCPAVSNRNLTNGRGPLHGNHLNGLPFYDLDLYFNRAGFNNNDLTSVNPLLVTYNINNGLQFVGRPIDPPPYCEIVASPPREGPPPPYASQENLSVRRLGKNEDFESKECSEVIVEPETTECDALLGASSQNVISVISCNAIDVVAESGERPSDFASEESVNPSTSERTDVEKVDSNCSVDIETSSENKSETSNKSSQCVGDDVSKCVEKGKEEPKSDSLDILVLKSCDDCELVADANDAYKIQNGESSSFVSNGSVADISNGAVKKIVSSRPFDSSVRRKNKTSPKNHLKKF